MGNSLLQSLPQLVDGLLLFEGFESANFVTDQAWTVTKGTPLRSNSVAKTGVYSLEMDLTECLISKTFSSDVPIVSSIVYFYDDATANIAGYSSPLVYWKDGGGNIYALGVDMTAPGSGVYSERHNTALAATAVARTTGWHRFGIKIVGTSVILSIDGTVVSTSTITFGAHIVTVQVGNPLAMTPVYSFGFFDVVQVYSSYNVQVSGLTVGQVVKLTNVATATVIATGTATTATVLLDIFAYDYPINGFFTITKPDGVRPQFMGQYKPNQVISQGDVWVLQTYDFGRKPSMFSPGPVANRIDTVATAGRQQSILFYDRDNVTMVFADLTEAKKNEFLKFWETIKGGQIFSAAVDSDKLFWSLLASSTRVLGGYTPNFVVPASLAGLQIGDDLLFRDAAGLNMMVGKLNSFGSSVTGILTTPFVSPYVTGDEVRHLYYWPFAITMDTQPSVNLTDLRQKRWTITLRFKEAI